MDVTEARDAGSTGTVASQKGGTGTRRYEPITHVFFHTLIMDTSKAFDGDKTAGL